MILMLQHHYDVIGTLYCILYSINSALIIFTAVRLYNAEFIVHCM